LYGGGYQTYEIPNNPSYNNRYTGMLVIYSTEDHKKNMDANCANYGGLYDDSVRSWISRDNPLKTVWIYMCNFGSWQYQKEQAKKAAEYQRSKEIKEKEDKVDKAKKECADLGYKKDTDKFKGCVLELI